jgi:hypothetical protein
MNHKILKNEEPPALKNRNDCRMKNDQTDARSALIEQSSIKSNLHSPIAHGSSIAPEEFLMNQQNKNNKRTNMNPNDETLKNEEFSGLKNEPAERGASKDSETSARSALAEQSAIFNQTNSSIEREALANVRSEIANLNSRLLTVMIDNAISDGRITPAQRESWFAELDRDFATKSVQLANTARVLKTQDSLENYARRIDPNSKDALQKRLQNAVQDEEKKGKTYDQAWTHVRREYPGLFTALYGADYFEKNPGLV